MYTARAAAATNATVGASPRRSQGKYPLQPPLESSPPLSPTSSRGSTSPPSNSYEDRPHSRDDDVVSSSTLYSRTQGSLYHTQIIKDVPMDDRPASSVAPSESAEDQSRRSSQGTPERTLRRTPRSRRIESPVQLEDDVQSPHSYTATSRQHDESASAPNGRAESVSSSVATPRRRAAYPLQAAASASSLRSLPTPPPSPTQQRQSESRGNSPPDQSQAKSSAVDTSSTHARRRKYPLQAPASLMDLHSAHVASASEEGKYPNGDHAPTANNQTRPEERTAPKSQPLRRQKYPLQAPASILDLRSAQAQPPAITVGLHDTQVQPPAPQKQEEDSQHSENKLAVRQTYPLQDPASTKDVQQPQPPPMAPNKPEQDEKGLTENEAQTRSSGALEPPKWQRRGYPMQHSELRAPSPRPVSPDSRGRSPDQNKSSKILLPSNLPAVVDAQDDPPKGRTIVVCLDGTGDQFDADNSNIVHLVSALKKDDPHQVTYYQAGIGTYSSGGLSTGFEAAADMAVGSGLGLHVRDAYHFLMHSYKEGDKICIFGFSRGAYTARCLAGMVHKVGLLPPRNIQQIYFAYSFYKDDSQEGWTNSADFKRTFCIDVSVYFIGCFDSVASVGIIPRQLPLSSTPTSKPRYFRHAMALDERRAKFKICRHTKKSWDDVHEQAADKLLQLQSHKAHNHPNLTDEEYARIAGPGPAFESDVLEVWFAGAHADIGGGAVKNVERHKLAQIPLRWMIRQAFECNTGIIFQTAVLAEHGLDVHTLWPKYERLKVPTHGTPPSFLRRFEKELPPRESRRSKLKHSGQQHHNGEPLYHLHSPDDDDWTPEQVEDFYDALTPLNDQLIQAPSWWILEAWPVQYKVPTVPGKCIVRTGMNWGQYRGVEDAEPKMHWTVAHRMQQLEAGYKIGVRTAKGVKWQTVV